MTSTCSLFWLDDFMRRPWEAEKGTIGRSHSPFMPANDEGTLKVGRFPGWQAALAARQARPAAPCPTIQDHGTISESRGTTGMKFTVSHVDVSDFTHDGLMAFFEYRDLAVKETTGGASKE
jgi:hypothetical protein